MLSNVHLSPVLAVLTAAALTAAVPRPQDTLELNKSYYAASPIKPYLLHVGGLVMRVDKSNNTVVFDAFDASVKQDKRYHWQALISDHMGERIQSVYSGKCLTQLKDRFLMRNCKEASRGQAWTFSPQFKDASQPAYGMHLLTPIQNDDKNDSKDQYCLSTKPNRKGISRPVRVNCTTIDASATAVESLGS